jgi:hypothetical protein
VFEINIYPKEFVLTESVHEKTKIQVRVTMTSIELATRIFPVVLYGCETWSLTMRKERRLRVFENRVLRRIFGPKRDEVTVEWRRLHNKELHALYSSPSIIPVMK